jgi:RNA polymerase sigma-70 factor (ECF subfamily)
VDDRTIDAARQGNKAAQATLLRQLQDPWFRMCLSMLRDHDKARDATQETALRFLKQLANYRGDAKLMTWSMGIAINVCRESRRIRLHASTDVEDAPPIEQGGPGPGELAVLSENESLVRSLLDELPDRQREAVVLRFFEELSVEETAQAMGCAEGTVKATIHQALRALRKKIEQMS